jgi:hypothetical protein
MAFALEKDPHEHARRTRVRLKLVAVLLTWLVTVPLLLVYGLTVTHRNHDVLKAAALITVLGPFVAAVIATKNHRFGLGGLLIVLTLLMTLPALAMVRL